jgi:hypothetical protein
VSSPLNESLVDSRPARPLWVPSVQEYAAMSWYQRQQFVQERRVVSAERVLVLVPCEKSHVEDLPAVAQDPGLDEARMHHRMVLMRRRAAAELAAVVVDPVEGDRNWNDLAEAIGVKSAVRHVW